MRYSNYAKNANKIPRVNIDWGYFADIPLEEICDLLGIEVLHGGKFLCPAHNDTNPSAGIDHKRNKWTCFSCGASGDGLDLVRIVKGFNSLSEAAFYLNEYYPGGIQATGELQENEEEIPRIPINLLKQIGLKENPFEIQTTRVPISYDDDNSASVKTRQPIRYGELRYTLDPVEAAELVISKCLSYQQLYQKQTEFVRKKTYSFLNLSNPERLPVSKEQFEATKIVLNMMKEQDNQNLTPIRNLAEEMRDIIAKKEHTYVPWEEIDSKSEEAERTVNQLFQKLSGNEEIERE